MKEPILEVNNLRVSFRTYNGKVQAVRGIDFKLYEGETLAIVGESGSGKSVTTKAILGILPKNSIIEEGEILYKGADLTKYKEKDFYRYTRIVGSGTAGNKNHFFQRRCIFGLYRSGPCSKI